MLGNVCILLVYFVRFGQPDGIGISLENLKGKRATAFSKDNVREVDGNVLKAAIERSEARKGFSPNEPGKDVRSCNPFFEEPSVALLKWAKQAGTISEALPELERVLGTTDGFKVGQSNRGLECLKAERSLSCIGYRYRTFEGICNNVQSPYAGSTGEPIRQDSASGSTERSLSRRSLPPLDQVGDLFRGRGDEEMRESDAVSGIFFAWAHFLYQDFAAFASGDGKLKCPNCCSRQPDGVCSGSTSSRHCFSFPRLLQGLGADCPLSPRSPANLASAYLDASQIYGSSAAAATRIRAFRQGKLTFQLLNGESFPTPTRADRKCHSSIQGFPCFRFGSHGLNLLPSTAAMGVLWEREHNRIAEGLGKLNPHWEEQRVFQEARRLVVAQIQHISFREFLPVLLGKEAVSNFGLELASQGYGNTYAHTTDPRPSAEFAFGAGLFFYSLRNLSASFPAFSVQSLYAPGAVAKILDAESAATMGESQLWMPPELTGKFLRAADSSLNWPLPELLTQMGRDGNAPSFMSARAACGLPVARSFQDLVDLSIMSPQAVSKLQRVYRNVDDIELLAGGLAEIPLRGGVVGPTFGCIIADHFNRIRSGDRFWYENHFAPSSFTDDQLSEIRKATMARILCDNAGIQRIPPSAMEPQNDFENCPLDCDIKAIPRIDLRAFSDSGPKIPVAFPDFIRARIDKIEDALIAGETRVKELEMRERARLLLKAKGLQNHARAPFLHFLVMFPDQHSIQLLRHAEIVAEATKLFLDKAMDLNRLDRSLTEEAILRLLPTVDVSDKLGGLPEDECLDRPWPCFAQAPFRSISGWCNNLQAPAQGASFTPFRRILAPAYHDGFSSPRRLSVTGEPLPSPRMISNRIHGAVKRTHPKYSRFLTQWGQYVDHDITLTPLTPGRDGFPLDCSACDSPATVSPNCFPIPIPTDDPFFTFRGTPQCMHFTRSLQGQQTLGFRQQINQITSYIDSSNVYGSDDCKAKSLRSFKKGQLLSQNNGLLPADPANGDCRSDSHAHFCFRAGDARVNEQAGLASTHTLFVREHNRISGELAKLNPQWDDERLYQETRRIVIAINQLINYREYLPKVIGWKMMEKYDLILSEQGYFDGYDSRCDATLPNSFSTAAFRFGHVMVEPSIEMMDEKAHQTEEHPLTELFFNASLLYGKNGLPQIFRGMCQRPSMKFDPSMHDQLRNHLFEFEGFAKSGLDLAGLNIQRGRDHGLPSYLEYRRHFNLRIPTSFQDLAGIVASPEFITALQNTYASVEDIDLFTGLTVEKHEVGAIVGETTGHILAEAFRRLRVCDRYWFENSGQAGTMTLSQIMEIRKMSASKIVCREAGIERIHPQIFSSPDAHQNVPLPCDQIPDMDFAPWKDSSGGCRQNGREVPLGGSFRESPCVSCTCISGGIRCYSVKVNNCLRLIRKFSLPAVAKDESCVIQCSGFIRLQS